MCLRKEIATLQNDVARFTDDNRMNPAVVLIEKHALSFMMQTTMTLLAFLSLFGSRELLESRVGLSRPNYFIHSITITKRRIAYFSFEIHNGLMNFKYNFF